MAVNKFTDLTWDEFRATYLNLKVKPNINLKTAQQPSESFCPAGIPSEFDWRDHNAVCGYFFVQI